MYILKINHLQACAGGLLGSQEVETLLKPQDGQMAVGKVAWIFAPFLCTVHFGNHEHSFKKKIPHANCRKKFSFP